MAVPTVVGTGAASAGTGDITPALPSGIQADDILILFVESAYGEAVTAPSGWEEAPNSPIETSSGGTRLSVFWKRAGGSESAPTVTDPGDHVIGAIIAFRGVIADKFPFLNTKSGTTAASSSKALSITQTQGITDVMYVGAITSGADGKTTGQFSNWASAALTSETERLDAFTDLGNGGGLGIGTGERASTLYTTDGTGWTVTDGSTTSAGAYWSGGLIPSGTSYPLVRGAGATASGTAAITLTMPDGVRENDILIAFLETANQDITISGWTEAGSSPASNTSGNATRATVLWKRAGASESSVTTSDSGLHQAGFVMAVVGAATSGDPFNVTSNTTSGSGTSVTIGGATTTTADCLVLNAVASTGSASFASWANADLTSVTAARGANYSNGVSLFGSVGVMHGRKTTAGAYGNTTVTLSGTGTSGSWAGWTGAIGSAGQTLSAEAGTLTVSSENAQFNWLFADAGTLSMAGEGASLFQSIVLSADAGTLSSASGDANLNVGYALPSVSSELTLIPYEANIIYNRTLLADAGAMSLTQGRYQIRAGNPAVSTLNFLIDLVPDLPSGSYQRFSERLRVGGQDVPLISWQYSESPTSVGGKLEFQIADISQRNLFFSGASVTFEVGVWDGSAFSWTPLLNTGILQNSQYTVSASGAGSRETLTVNAASEMEDRLNTAADANVSMVDPKRAPGYNVFGSPSYDSSLQLPVVRKLNGQTVQPKEIQLEAMGLHALLLRIFVTECGFSRVVTNIPDFKVTSFDVRAGEPYIAAVAGLIGIFEPVFSVFTSGGDLVLVISDGVSGELPDTGGGRTLTVSQATAMSLQSEFVKGNANGGEDPGDGEEGTPDSGDGAGQFIGWLDLTFNDKAVTRDWQNSVERVVNESITTGTIVEGAEEFTVQNFQRTYIDYYDSQYGELPIRSELKSLYTTQTMTTKQLDADGKEKTVQVTAEVSNEKFAYEDGELVERYKSVQGIIPMGRAPSQGNYSEDEYILIEGDRYQAFELRPVSQETERLSRAWHPFIPGRLYISSREVVVDGLLVVDRENGQTGKPYVRSALEVARAGNLVDGQYLDWGRISSVFERYSPNGDGTVNVSKVEHDYTAGQVSYNESRVEDGQIGYNARIGPQQQVAVTPEGADEAWGLDKLRGTVIQLNAGPLPRALGVAVGKRHLRNLRRVKKSYSLEMIGFDPYLQQGMLIRAYGPSGAFIGGFTVESRTLRGGPNGYTMSVQARTSSHGG